MAPTPGDTSTVPFVSGPFGALSAFFALSPAIPEVLLVAGGLSVGDVCAAAAPTPATVSTSARVAAAWRVIVSSGFVVSGQIQFHNAMASRLTSSSPAPISACAAAWISVVFFAIAASMCALSSRAIIDDIYGNLR
jgi:hypothetical protein